jgi:hypothetical protein
MSTLGKNILIIWLLMFVGTFMYAGSVIATVSETEVIRGDAVLLTITVVGEKSDKLPNIQEIAGIPVKGITRSSGSSYVFVNGQSKMEHTQTLTLEFIPENNMTIPAFQLQVDGVLKSTDLIELIVTDAVQGAKRGNENFELEIKVAKMKMYLGEPILVSIYFKQRTIIDLMQIDYSPPAFKEFFNKQLDGEKTYEKGGYTIHELTYILTPKREGNLTLEPARARVAERKRQRQIGGWYADVPKWSNISSSSCVLEVLKPSEVHDVLGDFKIKDTIDSLKVESNKPVNLQIEIIGEGNLEDYDGIVFDIPNVTIYSDDAKIESKLSVGKLQSRYLKSFVFIADHDFIIPAKSIRVFDYKRKKVKILKTKAYKIVVENGTKVATVPVVHTKQSVLLEPQIAVQSLKNRLESFVMPSYVALVGAFVLGAILMFLMQYFPTLSFGTWKREKLGFDGHDALRILYPHIGESKEIEEMVRQLYGIKSGEKGIEIDRQALKIMVEKYKAKGV